MTRSLCTLCGHEWRKDVFVSFRWPEEVLALTGKALLLEASVQVERWDGRRNERTNERTILFVRPLAHTKEVTTYVS
ncbi:MAG: hypothetical protein DSY43_01115 [Gammaproteobacteria bacterium]|nr:MAG: hypothetical protein DSY43_01115 [Gammaproteobacteria bacterium]